MKAIVVAALLLMSSTAFAEDGFKRYYATFHSCYDGDTCYFNFHLSAPVGLGVSLGAVFPKQGVRLCDIDTPEMRGGTEETKAAARLARDTISSWLKAAKHIEIEIPQKNNCDYTTHVNCDRTEKYGRWLGYLWADGVNLNKKLLEEGLAKLLLSRRTGKPILCRDE